MIHLHLHHPRHLTGAEGQGQRWLGRLGARDAAGVVPFGGFLSHGGSHSYYPSDNVSNYMGYRYTIYGIYRYTIYGI